MFLNSYRFLRWWALCSRNGNFPALCGCEGILGRKSTDDIVSFHFPFMFLSCCINFLSCCINILSCAFHVPFIMHSCPVIVRRYVSYQTYRSSKGYMLKPVRWVSARTGALLHMPLSFLWSFCYCFGGVCSCHLQGSCTCTCISSLSVCYSYRFPGNALVVLWIGQGEVPQVYPLETEFTAGLVSGKIWPPETMGVLWCFYFSIKYRAFRCQFPLK